MNRRPYFIPGIFIFLLILFDASQQKFYIDTFNLSGTTIPLGKLIFAHFIRWIIWLISSIPFGFKVWKKAGKDDNAGSANTILYISGLLIPFLVLAILVMSCVTILLQGLPFTWLNLRELMTFYFFQKGITFSMAYAGVALWLFNRAKSEQIDTQWLEIKGLRESSASLKSEHDAILPQISVKIGFRVKSILIRDIRWIQADDYCVRIHTEKQSYCLRKSLKFLEKELAPYHFIRVHRGALLNLDFLDQVNFESATITLRDNSTVPLSRSGEQILRRKMKAALIHSLQKPAY